MSRRTKRSLTMTRLWRDPRRRRHMSAVMKRQWRNPTYRRLRSEAMKGKWRSPTVRRRMSRAMQRVWAAPGYREKMSRVLTARWRDPTRRAARQAISRRNLGPSRGSRLFHNLLGANWFLEFWTPCGRIDIAQPGLKLAVEVDGPEHSRPKQRRRDRQKERQLVRLGWTVWRVSEASCRRLGGLK